MTTYVIMASSSVIALAALGAWLKWAVTPAVIGFRIGRRAGLRAGRMQVQQDAREAARASAFTG